MRKILVLTLVLLGFAGSALAQVPSSGNVFFGYSYLNTDLSSTNRTSLNGWEASVEGKIIPFLGIVADFGSYYGNADFTFGACPVSMPPCATLSVNENVTEQNYLFGPRVSVSVGRLRPFGEALFGAGHVNANQAGTSTSFATALGGGLDYRLIRFIAWRFQGDYLHTSLFGGHQNNVRLTTGIVIHF